mmetsp:Transcript_15071/g.45995  ORF Transcript_15071/g.45995 Transcript_15071/m.45995 type:complete len:206 (-) Transcript_15071:554-1171(-)
MAGRRMGTPSALMRVEPRSLQLCARSSDTDGRAAAIAAACGRGANCSESLSLTGLRCRSSTITLSFSPAHVPGFAANSSVKALGNAGDRCRELEEPSPSPAADAPSAGERAAETADRTSSSSRMSISWNCAEAWCRTMARDDVGQSSPSPGTRLPLPCPPADNPAASAPVSEKEAFIERASRRVAVPARKSTCWCLSAPSAWKSS